MDAHRSDPLTEVLSIDEAPISDQIAGRRDPRESPNDLLGCPCGGGIGRHIKMDVAPAMMCQNDKNKQHTKAKGG